VKVGLDTRERDELRALADPTRLRVFQALRARERCVRDVVACTGLSQPLVSHHLATLVRARLVQAQRAEGFTMYSVDRAGMAEALGHLSQLLDPAGLDPCALPGGNPGCCRSVGPPA
jgi:DNA-binding transcriptional ArsR family regulator